MIPGVNVRKLLTNITQFSALGGLAYDESTRDLFGAGDNNIVTVNTTLTTIRSTPSATPIIFDQPLGLTATTVQSQVTGAQQNLPGGYSGGTYATWNAIDLTTGQETTVSTTYSSYGGRASVAQCPRGSVLGSDPGDQYGPTGQLMEPPGISNGIATGGFGADGGAYAIYAHHRNAFVGRYYEYGTLLDGLGYQYMNPPTLIWVADNSPPFFAHVGTIPHFYGDILAEGVASLSNIGAFREGAFAITAGGGLGVGHQNRDVYANAVAPLHGLLVDGFGPSRPIRALSSFDGYVMGVDGGNAFFTWWQGRSEGPSRALKFLGTLPFSFSPQQCVVGQTPDGLYWGLFYGPGNSSDGYQIIAVSDTHQNSNPANVTAKDGMYVNSDPLMPGANASYAAKQMTATVDSRKVDAW